MSNIWLAADLLSCAAGIGASNLTAKIVWQMKHVVLTMVHVYHMLRRCGHLRAIPEVSIYLSSLAIYIYVRIYIERLYGIRSTSF